MLKLKKEFKLTNEQWFWLTCSLSQCKEYTINYKKQPDRCHDIIVSVDKIEELEKIVSQYRKDNIMENNITD